MTLPEAARDDEKYAYFGAQRRWFIVARVIAFGFLAVSLLRFSYHDPRISLLVVTTLVLIAASLLNLYTATRSRSLTRAVHERTVMSGLGTPPPSVDVFLPTAGERIEVLDNTYRHVKALQYPGPLEVYVLDDSGRDMVRELATFHGFTYLSREDRGRLKKAGNLKFGFEHSAGELIAVVDADFALRPDFLLNLVPYLKDPAIGIVQSPQHFDSRQSTGWLQRAAAAVQEFFYRWVQPSRDALEAPICVGTCAVYRRAALLRAGGFAQVQHSEDVFTGVRVMGAGFRVAYVPVILATGLCPDSIQAYATQQYRWCAGSMSLMLDPAFRQARLDWRQRLCFWTGFAYYLTTAMTAFTGFVPPIYLLWVRPHEIHAVNYLLLVPTLLTYPMIMLLYRARWRLSALRLVITYSFAHAVAIWDVWRRDPAGWVVTGGATRGTALSRRICFVSLVWLGSFQVLFWIGLARDLGGNVVQPSAVWPLMAFGVFAVYLDVPLLRAWLTRGAGSRPGPPTRIVAAG